MNSIKAFMKVTQLHKHIKIYIDLDDNESKFSNLLQSYISIAVKNRPAVRRMTPPRKLNSDSESGSEYSDSDYTDSDYSDSEYSSE